MLAPVTYITQKNLSYSQKLPLNRICSENSSYEKCCNKLQVWLKERGISDKVIKQKIHKANTYMNRDLLSNMKDTKTIIR